MQPPRAPRNGLANRPHLTGPPASAGHPSAGTAVMIRAWHAVITGSAGRADSCWLPYGLSKHPSLLAPAPTMATGDTEGGLRGLPQASFSQE
jgi:hypothetical protein